MKESGLEKLPPQTLSSKSLPANIGIETSNRRVQAMISLDEGRLVDLPDFLVVVPRAQVVTQMLRIFRQAFVYLPVDLTQFFVFFCCLLL